MIVDAEKSHNLVSVGWKLKKASDIVQSPES